MFVETSPKEAKASNAEVAVAGSFAARLHQ